KAAGLTSYDQKHYSRSLHRAFTGCRDYSASISLPREGGIAAARLGHGRHVLNCEIASTGREATTLRQAGRLPLRAPTMRGCTAHAFRVSHARNNSRCPAQTHHQCDDCQTSKPSGESGLENGTGLAI